MQLYIILEIVVVFKNHIGGVMVCALASTEVYRRVESMSAQTNVKLVFVASLLSMHH